MSQEKNIKICYKKKIKIMLQENKNKNLQHTRCIK
jgi:hypothetical protein